MTPRAFATLREALGWSRVQLANAIGLDESQIRRWESGRATIPAPLAAWLREATTWLRQHPPPKAPYPKAGPAGRAAP